MTTPAKTTNKPAQKPASKPAETSKPAAKPALDFAALGAPETVAAPARNGGSAPVPENILTALRKSWMERTVMSPELKARPAEGDKPAREARPATHKGSGQRYTVPSELATDLEQIIRRGAVTLGYGATVTVSDAGGGKSHVDFAAKTARNYRKSQA